MRTLSERALRQVVKTELTNHVGTADKALVTELVDYLGNDGQGSQTKVEAAIIRTIDKYHGVSEQSLQTGRSIYDALYNDED